MVDELSDAGMDDGAETPSSDASDDLQHDDLEHDDLEHDDLEPGNEIVASDPTDGSEPDEPRPKRRRGRLLLVLLAVAVIAAVVAAVFDTPGLTTFAALLLGLVILRIGWFFLQSFATPPPPPPDRGKLRRVKLVYRCNVCGAEVRMTVANDEDPEPPRHCMDDMQLISPID